MVSDFVGVVILRSVCFLTGESSLGFFSGFGRLLYPSGSGLVGVMFRSELEAVEKRQTE